MDVVVWPLAALALLVAATGTGAVALRTVHREVEAAIGDLPALRRQIDALRADLGARPAAIGLRRHR